MICQRCIKDVAGDGVHTCTPSDLVRKLEEHRDALLIDLAASLGREDALLAALEVLRDRVQDEYDRMYISGVVAKVKP